MNLISTPLSALGYTMQLPTHLLKTFVFMFVMALIVVRLNPRTYSQAAFLRFQVSIPSSNLCNPSKNPAYRLPLLTIFLATCLGTTQTLPNFSMLTTSPLNISTTTSNAPSSTPPKALTTPLISETGQFSRSDMTVQP